MNVIPTRVHGMMDYLGGVLLIAAPSLFGFAQHGPETWLPVALGMGMIGMAMLTKYELGVIPVIPMKVHLVMDALLGAFLAASPWVLGFADDVWAPFVILGLLEVGAAAMTQTESTHHYPTGTHGMRPTV